MDERVTTTAASVREFLDPLFDPTTREEQTRVKTHLDPVEAAASVGMTAFEFDNIVRDQAAMRLENLATRIRHGNEAREGDIEYDHYHEVVADVWRQVEAAKVLTAAWVAEVDADA